MELFSSVANFWERWSETSQFFQVFVAGGERRRKKCLLFPTLETCSMHTFLNGAVEKKDQDLQQADVGDIYLSI